MSYVRPYFVALLCAAALSACAGSSQAPANQPGPTPTDVVSGDGPSNNPFLNDYTPPDDDRTLAHEGGGGHEGGDRDCVQRFKLNLFVAGEGDRPDWEGEGRLRVNTCVGPDAQHDGIARVRLPDINRGVEVKIHKQDDSTEDSRHYVGRRLRGYGEHDEAGMVLWTVDAHVTQHSVHPFVRTQGTVTRVRSRWMLDADGNLVERNDELTAEFTGNPTNLPEPDHCPNL